MVRGDKNDVFNLSRDGVKMNVLYSGEEIINDDNRVKTNDLLMSYQVERMIKAIRVIEGCMAISQSRRG